MYKVSEKTKNKISKSLKTYYRIHGHPSKGRKVSETTRKKISKSVKTYFRVYGSPLKGIPFSEEHKRKLNLTRIGRKHTEEAKRKMRGRKSSFFGKHHSEESKRKLRLSHLGKSLTEETREKIRNSMLGEKNHFFGKNHSEDTKQRLREICRVKSTGKNNPMYGQHHSRSTLEKIHDARLHQVFPSKDTKIEVALQEGLKEEGITHFETHFPIFGQPDIAFPQKKVAVFCDGDYWHSTPKAKKRDKLVNDTLEEKGWSVLRFWGHEIRNDLDSCVLEIMDSLL